MRSLLNQNKLDPTVKFAVSNYDVALAQAGLELKTWQLKKSILSKEKVPFL
jgi:hypothetical protein